MTNVDQVMSSLKKVVDPELHKDIVSMGMIKDLTIRDKKVSFTLELTTPACPFNSEIEQEVRNSMQSIGVNDLDLKVTAKVMEGRAISMDELLPRVKNIFAVASEMRTMVEPDCTRYCRTLLNSRDGRVRWLVRIGTWAMTMRRFPAWMIDSSV